MSPSVAVTAVDGSSIEMLGHAVSASGDSVSEDEDDPASLGEKVAVFEMHPGRQQKRVTPLPTTSSKKRWIRGPSTAPTRTSAEETAAPWIGRKRVLVACYSCIRLKVKCDALQPCESCVRRGVQCEYRDRGHRRMTARQARGNGTDPEAYAADQSAASNETSEPSTPTSSVSSASGKHLRMNMKGAWAADARGGVADAAASTYDFETCGSLSPATASRSHAHPPEFARADCVVLFDLGWADPPAPSRSARSRACRTR